MKISVAQTRPIKGDLRKNIENHKKLINIAVSGGADIVIFPELSLTGFEPELAKDLATDQDDSKFDDLQKISDTGQITIGVGMPTKGNSGICISMIIFQPGKSRQTYSKQYLHPDEYPFFIKGQHQVFLTVNNTKVAPGICYETSIPAHSENAYNNGAKIYIASVLSSVKGFDNDIKRLSAIAKKYEMTVLMANFAGESGGYECAGKTSVWNSKGLLAGQLDNTNEGIIIIDTDTQEITERYYKTQLFSS